MVFVTRRISTLALGLIATAGLTMANSSHAWEWGSGVRTKGSGHITSTTRPVSGITGVTLELAGELEVVQGSKEGIVIETDDNIAPLIETVVERGTLIVRLSSKTRSISTDHLRFTVTAPVLERLNVEGSGSIFAKRLSATTLKCNIGGSGSLKLGALEATDLRIAVAGSGEFEAQGRAESVEVSVAGSGDVDLGKLDAKRVKVSVAGSGDVTVSARDALKVSVAGSGDVRYYGDPTVSKSIAGSGSVERLGKRAP